MRRLTLALGVACLGLMVLACGGGGDPGRAAATSSKGAAPAAPETPLARYRRLVTEGRAERVPKAEAEFEAAAAAVGAADKRVKKKIADRWSKAQVEQVRAELTAAQSRLDRAQADLAMAKEWAPTASPDELRAGDVALLRAADGQAPVFTVLQVIDSGHVLLQHAGQVYYVDTGTRDLVDGQRITLAGPVECVGTRQYETVLGASRTVRAWVCHPE